MIRRLTDPAAPKNLRVLFPLDEGTIASSRRARCPNSGVQPVKWPYRTDYAPWCRFYRILAQEMTSNPNDAVERQPDGGQLHFANYLVEAPPEAAAPACPPVCFDAVGRNSPRRQFAPNRPRDRHRFPPQCREGKSFLAHADDGRDFVVEQCHAPRILCRSQLATMFWPTRIAGHIGFLRYR